MFLNIAVSAALLSFAHFTNGGNVSSRATGGYVQNPSGSASFTMYTGCSAPGMLRGVEDHLITNNLKRVGSVLPVLQLQRTSLPSVHHPVTELAMLAAAALQ